MAKLLVMRHAACPGNLEHRYVGCRTDGELAREGVESCWRFGAARGVERVYVSPLERCRQTAQLLFPSAQLEVVEDLREMDFGDFESRTADEMADDKAYRKWVDGQCQDACPKGESQAQFIERTIRAVCGIVAGEQGATDSGELERPIVIVAHGGTVMATMSTFASPPRPYFEWQVSPCEGYVAEVSASLIPGVPRLENAAKVRSMSDVGLS